MKTKTTATLVFALGVFSTGAFAENTSVPTAPAPNAIAAPAPAPDRLASIPQSSGAEDSARVAAPQELTAKQIAQLEHDFNAKYQANDGLVQNFAEQALPDTGAIFAKAEFPTVVFSEPPSPAFYYDANAPAHWYLSVSFHFDWGRNRHS
jgi:hypothetical protein